LTQYTLPFDYEMHVNTFDQKPFSILRLRKEPYVCNMWGRI
jgi:hypothetical protein